jgi:hypothetical protein
VSPPSVAAPPPAASVAAPPPSAPQAGASTSAPTHRTDHPPQSTTAESTFTMVTPGRRVTRLTTAIDAATTIVAASTHVQTPKVFTTLDDDSTPPPADGSLVDDDVMVRKDGASQPLLSDAAPIGEVDIGTITQTATTATNPIVDMLLAHDLAVSTAIADFTTSPSPAPPQSNHDNDDNNDDDDSNDDASTASPTTIKATLNSILKYIKKNERAVTDLKRYIKNNDRAVADINRTTASHVTRIDTRLDAFGDQIDHMRATMNKTVDKLGDVQSKLCHHVKKFNDADLSISTRMDNFVEATNNRFDGFATRLVSLVSDNTPRSMGRRNVDVRGSVGHDAGDDDIGAAVVLDMDDLDTDDAFPRDGATEQDTQKKGVHQVRTHNVDDGITQHPPQTTPPPRRNADPTGLVLPEDVYTLPTGHFGSGLGGPSSTTRLGVLHRDTGTSARQDNTTASNARAAHMAGPAGRFAETKPTRPPPINPYTPVRPPAAPTITPPRVDTSYDDSSEVNAGTNNGGPILSPRAQADRIRGLNRFDLEAMAHPQYHGYADGTRVLTFGFLENCGYNMLASDDVVGSLNELIALHGRVHDTWFNASANTYGPQIDRILLKLFKLFPTLDCLDTADVVNFYDRLQELSNPHLLPLIPFDSITLKYRFEGLFSPGLGTRRYATCGWALMDFLPRLIPATLSSRVNATLTVVRCESMNGFDYLWRVLELYVPGFDPVLAIETPRWEDSNDIFHFAQAYLLYFRLQGKVHFHFTDRTRSGIFLRAIQHSDYADTVTLLQTQVNSYREDFDTGSLPTHLRLHGLAESIHMNAQSCLRDIVSPRVRRIDVGATRIQGLPDSPSINRFGRSDRPAVGFRDRQDRGSRDGRDCNPQVRDELRSDRPPRLQRGLPRADRNRRPFLSDVQCDVCGRVGHVAKNCDMLATAICLEKYMRHDLPSTTRDAIEKDWVAKWKDRLGNPTRTPRQVMRTYVEDLDITVTSLDKEMDWDCWEGEFDPIPEIADA